MKIHVTAADGYVFGKSRTRGSKAWILAEKSNQSRIADIEIFVDRIKDKHVT